MEQNKMAKLEEVYTLATSSVKSDKPKHVLFGWKCPKCQGKLGKSSLSDSFFAEEGCSAFTQRIAGDAKKKSTLNTYVLSIDHFTCTCGYQFAKAHIEPLTED